MKLANALSQRSELQTRIRQLEVRLNNNALVQEGEEPAEDPKELLQELDGDYAQLEDLMARINRTNCETRTESGTLTELLARRACLKLRVETYRNFLAAASHLTRRATRSEIKICSTVVSSGFDQPLIPSTSDAIPAKAPRAFAGMADTSQITLF